MAVSEAAGREHGGTPRGPREGYVTQKEGDEARSRAKTKRKRKMGARSSRHLRPEFQSRVCSSPNTSTPRTSALRRVSVFRVSETCPGREHNTLNSD